MKGYGNKDYSHIAFKKKDSNNNTPKSLKKNDGRKNKLLEKKKDFLKNIFQIYKDSCLKSLQSFQIPSIDRIEQIMDRNFRFDTSKTYKISFII